MFKSLFKSATTIVCGILLGMILLSSTHAVVSQDPLLTKSSPVQPNLVLMFDDSASMPAQFVYQYGGSEGVFGRTGPGNNNSATCGSTLSITTTCAYTTPGSTDYYEMSPNINGLYYNPKVRYRTRVDASGTFVAAPSATTTTFTVYFYKNGSGANVDWPGTSPGVSATFPTPTLVTSYFGTTTYIPSAALLASSATLGLPYPTVVSPTGTRTFPKFINRTDCNGGATGGSCSLLEERQNYSNWRKYHSNRLDLAKTGLGYAFKDIVATIRLGWGVINTLDGGNLDSGVSVFDPTRKSDFYTWLYARTGAIGGTPNRLALQSVGNYYARADNKGPWASTPDKTSTGTATLSFVAAGDSAAIRAAHYSCRRSYAMLVTDGYYNDGSPGVGNVDGTTQPTITGTSSLGAALSYTYNGTTKPYAQSQSDTFADVAMKYWVTDLRPDVQNRVKVIPDTIVGGVIKAKGNESFWQNMSFYAVGLGVYGTLPQTTPSLASLTTGTATWPTMSTNDETSIDDMWHATINGRGRLLSAKNADELSAAVVGMLADINKLTSTQSGVAISTANLQVGTRKYTPRYQTGSWTGNVVARNLDPNTGNETSTAWQVVGSAFTGTTTVTFAGIPSYTARNVVAWNGSSAIAFTYTSAITNSMTSTVSANMVSFLRGDQSNEGTNGAALYRPREYLLGDIVNSTPAFVKEGVDLQYDLLPSTATEYATYRTFYNNKAARTEGAVFVGANDGMLHAFRETTGAEVFAYIPRAVLPNLHQLADKNYTHRFFVDGPNIETDSYNGTNWKNLLLGTTGAGAKAVYALDVTSPMAMTTTSVLWEIRPDSNSNFSELGHVLSEVQSGRTPSGDWVAVFGNGYDSTSGYARLYIVNLNTGAFIKYIDADTAGSNGLGAVRLVRDAKQQVIGAYAGDLKGKMWKFDLTGTTSSSWSLGLNSNPLFNAGTSKPITAAPAVIPHPQGGYVIAFATGKLFEDTDVASTNTQSVYGILDSIPFGSPTSAPTATVALSNLITQTIVLSSTDTRTITNIDLTQSIEVLSFYSVSKNTVTYSATVRGWHIILPNTGQRNVYPVESLSNRYLAVDTISPANVNASDPCAQSGQGQGWLYFIDGLTGGGPTEAILDTNGDGQINTSDNTSSGLSTTADGRNLSTKIVSRSNATQTTYANMGGGRGDATVVKLSCVLLGTCTPPGGGGGTNPSDIKYFPSREWRQLFMR